MHHRQSIRLQGYDYSRPGYYFITICSAEQEEIFCSIREGTVHLTDIGKMIMKCWQEIPVHFANVTLDYWVIMPNHIHGILIINDRRDTACRVPTQVEKFSKPTVQSIPTIIRSVKSAVTKEVHNIHSYKGKIWQGRYWEHIIRDERELSAIREYIQNNPLNWHLDSLNKKK